MKRSTMLWLSILVGMGTALAGPKPATELPVPLTAAGEKLQAEYEATLTALRAQILQALPAVEESKKAAFLKAYAAEATATAAELKAGRALNGKPKDKEAAEKARDAAKAALAQAKAAAQLPAKAILAELDKFLASDKLDAKLVKAAVLAQATPRGLAEFAQQGPEQQALVKKLLADTGLMKQMLIAGGANGGKYGRAMEIYTAIQKASPQARRGELQRLALATALEHAVPIEQKNPEADKNAPRFVDPVKRYLHFEKAYLDGELDPAFKNLTVWEYRNVVNGDETEDALTWGRAMLRNYRPDHIATPDYKWRYVKAVKTDVKYGSADQKNDLPTNQLYQNIIMTGGVCGRRAWFGGFILRCFGIPIVRRPQEGHAALAHWTPEGWVINFGAGWDWGWTKYGEGIDFEQYTQARKNEAAFLPVLRAQWMGDVLGEKRVFGMCDEPSGFWNGVALYRQRAIVEAAKVASLGAVGTDIGEANVSKEKEHVVHVNVTEADKKVDVSPTGVITIPAVACVNTSTNVNTIVFMKSNLGGLQMHYERVSQPATFEYTFHAPQAGQYALTARVVTVSPEQHLLLTVNDAAEPVVVNMPYTRGMWQTSAPVTITLAQGKNVLRFDRKPEYRGLTIKDFTLTPVK
jgi:hypothetical protein